MNRMLILLIVIVIVLILWILAVGGRRGARQIHELDGWLYAHRGYHMEPDAPENSAAAFRLAAERGFGAELDVHLLSDGNLAVLHDSSLKRMTGEALTIEDLTVQDLKDHFLGKSRETIPALEQVLEIFQGKAPLIIELKTHKGNHAALCQAVCRALEGYEGVYCIESFDPKVLRWLRKNRPEIIRGQLSTNFFREDADLSFPLAFLGTCMLENFLTRPDFIAYRFKYRKQPSNWICLKLWRLSGASWTIRSADELRAAQKEGLWPIFENFDPMQK